MLDVLIVFMFLLLSTKKRYNRYMLLLALELFLRVVKSKRL